MGLAEPRKRIKIAHDPRNLSWSQSTTSFGHRLMAQQGWKEGQSLGARTSKSSASDDAARLQASRVGVLFKDDTLGLGAQLKSQDVANQKTGLDAFQGLLGRLNGKSDEELKKVEKKAEDRKLAMWAQGRWGGMVFVPGGLLVQGDPFKEAQKNTEEKKDDNSTANEDAEDVSEDEATSEVSDKKKRKEEKRQRKEEKKTKKAAKLAAREKAKEVSDSVDDSPPVKLAKASNTHAPDEPISSAEEDASQSTEQESKHIKRRRSQETESSTKPATKPALKNGRHILRGRNIQAKRMAFSDTKGLDEIFMRKT